MKIFLFTSLLATALFAAEDQLKMLCDAAVGDQSYIDNAPSIAIGPNQCIRHVQIMKLPFQYLKRDAIPHNAVARKMDFCFSRGLLDDDEHILALAPLYIINHRLIDLKSAKRVDLFVAPEFNSEATSDDRFTYFCALMRDVLLRYSSLPFEVCAINVRVSADFQEGRAFLQEQGFVEYYSDNSCIELAKDVPTAENCSSDTRN